MTWPRFGRRQTLGILFGLLSGLTNGGLVWVTRSVGNQVLGSKDAVLDPGGEGHEGDQHDVQNGGYRPVDGDEHWMLPSRSFPVGGPGGVAP